MTEQTQRQAVRPAVHLARMQHLHLDFAEGVPSTSLCGLQTVSTTANHDPAAPKCVVCLDLDGATHD